MRNLVLDARRAQAFSSARCPTEFQLDIKHFHNKGVALVVTRWLVLGEGHTVSNPWYASHAEYYFPEPVSFNAGSIKAAYEGEDLDMEKLLTPKHSLWWWRPYRVPNS